MQIKNKSYILFFFLVFYLFFNLKISAEEFNITAKEIIIDKENEIIIGKGDVIAEDNDGKIIYANKITYEKSKEFLLAEGDVKIDSGDGNILKTNKSTYDKINEIITTYSNTELILKEGYNLKSKNILYNTLNKILSSNKKSTFTDIDGNIVEASMFQYDVKNNLFSSIGNIKITDINKNKYHFKEIHVDTLKKEMIGSDISVVLDEENFGVDKKNDPRFVANDILYTKNKTILSKGVFTVCEKKDDECPPWSIKAKKITYDKIKKNIYYDHATLKIYDVPIFYFPKFFHPDPSIKRRSGFLFPSFTNSTTTGTGFATPYFWAINRDKDITFTPKIFVDEHPLLLNEYRQAFVNGFLTLDTSYTQGFKNTSKIKTAGSKSHFFADLKLNFDNDEIYQKDFSLKIQKTSNDSFFRQHNINTALVDSENTNLENVIKYNLSKDNMYLNITASVYENLREKSSARYEYILPNIIYGKTFFTERFGIVDFSSNALYSNYKTNRHKKMLTNDVVWKTPNNISQNGFVNSIEGMLRNINYKTTKTSEYKNGSTVNELQGVMAYKTSLPLKKDGVNYSNIFAPNFMFRYAPGHMRNLSGDNAPLSYTNLYALNKTTEIETGISAILGMNFKINEKVSGGGEKEKLSLSLGQIFNHEVNKKIPSASSLDQKMSDVVGEINYNFSKIGKIDYKFLLDNNLNDLNYNEVSTELNFGKIKFNLDYLEENKHVGSEHYATSGITLNLNDNNKFNFSTKKNFKTDSTELYDLSYQYELDCLKAGIVYRREFYQDSDLEPNNNLMFTITFVPFGTVNTPDLDQ